MAKTDETILMGFEDFEKKLRWLIEVQLTGSAKVEIQDKIDPVIVPADFYQFCLKWDLKPDEALFFIVSDFVQRYKHGTSMYEQGILNRIKLAENLSEYERKKVIHAILQN